MAKFRSATGDLDLLTGQVIDFDDDDTIQMGHRNTGLFINSTVSGVWAVDGSHLVILDQLTQASGSLVNYFNTTLSGQDEFIELLDTPTTYTGSAGKSCVVNDAEDGLIFKYAQPGATATGTTPPDPGDTNLWYNNEDHQLYYWDEDRYNWLSIMSHYYMWTYNGAADGAYMSIGNVQHDSAYYYIPQPATIISVSSSAQKSQNSSKGFEVETAVSGTILTFNHTDWVYRDNTLNVRLDPEDEVKCYIESAGPPVRNSIVTLEIKWRYEAS